MDLSVVIVSWNCREELRGCLAALRDEPPSGAWELFVVDNASADDTAEMVRREFPQVRLIANEDNRGFAAANNQALQEATGDCLLLLNPDTQPEAGAIDILIRFLHEHPGVGVVGPKLLNSDGSLQATGRPFPTLWREFLDATGLRCWIPARTWRRLEFGREDFDSPAPVGELRGACLLIRREAWEQVGPLDEQFFLFYEEVDWCCRAAQAGWEVWYVPQARVVHLWMSSVSQDLGGTTRHFYTSQARYFGKHHGAAAAVAARGIGALGRGRNALLRLGSRVKQWFLRRRSVTGVAP